MARIIEATGVTYGSEYKLYGNAPVKEGGISAGTVPALYDDNGHFVEVVNLWFLDLKTVKRLSDIGSSVRALLRYWSFLESYGLVWDEFPPVKRLKPTYLYRNNNLIPATREGSLAFTTANTYMNHVIQFYIWAIESNLLTVLNEKEAPFSLEFIKVENTDMLAHLKPRICVQTSDLRIRVPRHSDAQLHSLTPLSTKHLSLLSVHLATQSTEFILMVMLACESGLRLSEVCSFTLKALSQASPVSEFNVRFNVPVGPANGVATKFRKTRKVEISQSLLTTLQRYAISERRSTRYDKFREKNARLKQPAGKSGEVIKEPERYEPLFISQQGNKVKPDVLNARWIEFRNSLSKSEPDFRYKFHDLRSTYATMRLHSLLESGLSEGEALDCVMGWMGHNHESTTFKYIRFLKYNENIKESLSLLDSVMESALRGCSYE